MKNRKTKSQYKRRMFILMTACIFLLTACGSVQENMLQLLDGNAQTFDDVVADIVDANAQTSVGTAMEVIDDSADEVGVEENSSNDLSMFPTPPPIEDIKEWVEYENGDGSYTKGSELIEKANKDAKAKEIAQKTEQGKLLESDMDSIPSVAAEDALAEAQRSAGLYYYELLSENEKYLYGEVLYILDNMLSEVKVSTLDENQIEKVFDYVINDHPEIFFAAGYHYTKYTLGDSVKSISLTGTYTMQPEERKSSQTYVDSYVQAFLDMYNTLYPDGTDDYHKIKFTYEYIISGTEYMIDSANNQNILSVMIGHYSVCQGYAKAYQYLLDKLGVKATIAIGTGKGGEPHAWNLVKSDGEYYYVDATWGDASYSIAGNREDLLNSVPPVNYDYLLVTTSEILRNHTLSNPDIMPECTSLYDNYYIRENLLFDDVDEEQLQMVFNKGYAQNMEYITLKMTNEEVYDKMWNYLFKEQHVFSYLMGEKTTISYAEGRETLYMVLWI